ncbi:hypothetical protein HG463_003235 [Candidatus Saccharibacteria bacterium]|nr:hypothetical protein [Candidatus Saccharibacteria bacterium]
MLDNKRISVMRVRLGVRASRLIKDDKFLPMFRNRQIKYQREFEESVKIAEKKRNPEHFFASIWACKNIEKTLKLIRSVIYRAIEKVRELQESIKRIKTEQDIQANINPIGLAQFAKMKHDLFGL